MQGFEVIQGGLLTTIQDLGRYGYAHLGMTQSGAMDEVAYRWGQKLLGNQNGNALEILLAGFVLKATANTQISVTGANLNFRINNVSCPIWQIHSIQKDDILSFKQRVSGQRAYLAVKGGFDVKQEYGSFSTTLRDNMGSKLKRGDFLSFKTHYGSEIKRLKKEYIPDYNKPLTLNLILTHQHDLFSEQQKEQFFKTTYTITPQINRMGYKLQGFPLIPSKGGIISEAIPYGAVQIPKDGQPIVLLKEHQTIGGYPKIGTVLPIDCFKLSQVGIGENLQFKEIGIKEAEKKMKYFHLLW